VQAQVSERKNIVVTKLDFVAIPSRNAERSRSFYSDTLGLRPDARARYELWAGETLGREFAAQQNAHLALHVDDVAASRAELERQGVSFYGDTLDTGVCLMAFFTDPDGNDLMLHHRYAAYD
jgi:catechol 2,3-dioxygenase-like lactoylglutathione lyase family enzyme